MPCGTNASITNTMAKKNTQLDEAIKRRGLNMMRKLTGETHAQSADRREHNVRVGKKLRSLAGRSLKGSLIGLLEDWDG